MVVNRVLNRTNISKLFIKQNYTRNFRRPKEKVHYGNTYVVTVKNDRHLASRGNPITSNQVILELRHLYVNVPTGGEKIAQGKLSLIVST